MRPRFMISMFGVLALAGGSLPAASQQRSPTGQSAGSVRPPGGVLQDPVFEAAVSITAVAERAAEKGRYAEAESWARNALAQQWYAPAAQLLAETLAVQGKTEEALATYRTLIYQGQKKMVDRDAIVLLPCSLLLARSGQWAEAVTMFNTAAAGLDKGALPKLDVRFDPRVPQLRELDAAAHIGIGMAGGRLRNHSKLPDPNKLLVDYRWALDLEPDWGLAVFYYGDCLHDAGLRKEAKPYIDRAAKIGSADVQRAVKDLYGPHSHITITPAPPKPAAAGAASDK